MTPTLPLPQDGGSYRRAADGSLHPISPTTGDRPCRRQAHAPRPKARGAPKAVKSAPTPSHPDKSEE